MLKSGILQIILIFNALILLICLFAGYRFFTGASRLVGNNVVYITSEPGRGQRINLDSVKDGMEALYGYNIAFEYRRGATATNNNRNTEVNLAFVNDTYFRLNHHVFLHGGGWPYSFNSADIIILSENAAWELFGYINVIHLHAEMGGQFFEVSGVIAQENPDDPGFAYIPYNHSGSGATHVTGIYIQGRNYNTMERHILSRRFAHAADLNVHTLRFIDLDQYAYNILIKFNIFSLSVSAAAGLFFTLKLSQAVEPAREPPNILKSAIYGSLTAGFIVLCLFLWQSTGPNLPPPTQAFRIQPLIDILTNSYAFEGTGSLSHHHQGLHEFNRLSAYPLAIGAFAFANIALAALADTVAKTKLHTAKRGSRASVTIPEYILKRILQIIPTFMIMTFVIFNAMLLMPTAGMPYFPRDAHIMYFRYIFSMLQGDFGTSWGVGNGELVSLLLIDFIPVTLILVFGAIAAAGVIGVLLGVSAAIKQNKLTDNIIMASALFISSIPLYAMGIILMLIFSLHLQWLPVRGMDGWRGMIMPITALAVTSIAFIARTTRTAMLEVLTMPCISAARARGLPERNIIIHALANMRIPIITAVNVRLAELFMGTFIVELIFSVPGLGRLILQAITTRDRPALMGGIIVFSLMFMIINLIVDLLYVIVDPRTKRSFK